MDLLVSPDTILGVFFIVHILFVGSTRSGEKANSNSLILLPEPFSKIGTTKFLVVPGSTVDSTITKVLLDITLATDSIALLK